MFEKLLYPTDFSDVSQKSLDYIRKLKEAGAKEVVVLHVLDERELATVRHHALGLFDAAERLEKTMFENAGKSAAIVKKELELAGLAVKVRIEKGIPFREILRVEEEENVSAVVVGSHGHGMLEEVFLGSVSEKVVKRSTRPVIVVRR